ncbi:MAG: protein kinase [Microcoleaceae cyanobacterium]
MNKNKNKPWDENWEIIEQIGSGCQGKTFLVKPRKDVFLSNQYVLKKLIKQNDLERRGRMYREVAALTTLNSSGIPKVVDSNAELFDSDIPLYMVTEFVPGATLFEAIKEKTMSITDAVNFVIKLLDIMEYCHQVGIVHRDIKPDNIIIKNNNINNPVLIDFGLSFNKVDDFATSLTLTGQQLGNRFLSLPELLEKSSLQRDPRSDITQICGILFFVITGKNPTTFFYSEEKKPHQRTEIKQNLSVLSESILANTIFKKYYYIGYSRY